MNLLTVKELADLLKITEQAVRNNISRHNMPHYRICPRGGYRFDLDEVLTWMRGHAQGACTGLTEALSSSTDVTACAPQEDAHGPTKKGREEDPNQHPARRDQAQPRRVLDHLSDVPESPETEEIRGKDSPLDLDLGSGRSRATKAHRKPENTSDKYKCPPAQNRNNTDRWGLRAVLARGTSQENQAHNG